jgi:hypothetical protein
MMIFANNEFIIIKKNSGQILGIFCPQYHTSSWDYPLILSTLCSLFIRDSLLDCNKSMRFDVVITFATLCAVIIDIKAESTF